MFSGRVLQGLVEEPEELVSLLGGSGDLVTGYLRDL